MNKQDIIMRFDSHRRLKNEIAAINKAQGDELEKEFQLTAKTIVDEMGLLCEIDESGKINILPEGESRELKKKIESELKIKAIDIGDNQIRLSTMAEVKRQCGGIIIQRKR